MALRKELSELLNAGVITPETASGIEVYYKNREPSGQKKLFTIFGILGAVLTALGIILVLAHNWDDLPVKIKTLLAFVPLLIGQSACAFSILKKRNVAWQEGSSVFLFLSIGASISLVSQIYHISGELPSFILTWMLLGLPLIYLMRSSVTTVLFVVGITVHNVSTGFWGIHGLEKYWYWILLAAALPHYYLLCRKQPESNFITFFNWIVPISLTIALGTLSHHKEELITIAYMSLFGVFYLIGDNPFFREKRGLRNGYLMMGSLGTAVVLLICSFDPFWKGVVRHGFMVYEVYSEPEFIAGVLLSAIALVMFIGGNKSLSLQTLKPVPPVFILFIIAFMVGCSFSVAATVMDNIILLALALLTIREGIRRDHLGIVNYGVLVIAALAVTKFFDTHISFVVRGSLFIAVGIGCFAVNYFMLKRRNNHE